jgi:ABC-type antimicrobial peptide transport system permease subunit
VQFGINGMKGRTVFGIVGWGLLGLGLLSFVFNAVRQVASGQDVGYSNFKHQPMTYLGMLATLAIVGIVGVIGLYYRIKKVVESRRDRQVTKAAEKYWDRRK